MSVLLWCLIEWMISCLGETSTSKPVGSVLLALSLSPTATGRSWMKTVGPWTSHSSRKNELHSSQTGDREREYSYDTVLLFVWIHSSRQTELPLWKRNREWEGGRERKGERERERKGERVGRWRCLLTEVVVVLRYFLFLVVNSGNIPQGFPSEVNTWALRLTETCHTHTHTHTHLEVHKALMKRSSGGIKAYLMGPPHPPPGLQSSSVLLLRWDRCLQRQTAPRHSSPALRESDRQTTPRRERYQVS